MAKYINPYKKTPYNEIVFRKEVGDRIKYIRNKRKITGKEAYKEYFKSPESAACNIESGYRSINPYAIAMLAEKLNTTVESFFTDKPIYPNPPIEKLITRNFVSTLYCDDPQAEEDYKKLLQGDITLSHCMQKCYDSNTNFPIKNKTLFCMSEYKKNRKKDIEPYDILDLLYKDINEKFDYTMDTFGAGKLFDCLHFLFNTVFINPTENNLIKLRDIISKPKNESSVLFEKNIQIIIENME